MKNFKVMSAYKAQLYVNEAQEKLIVISIDSDGDRNEFKENPNVLGILYLTFLDVTSGEYAMTQEQADSIVEFVNEYIDKVDTIVVHCDAGVSRSAGVGAALMLHINGDDSSIFNGIDYYPNMTCFRLMLKALTGHIDEDIVAAREKIRYRLYDNWPENNEDE